MQCQGDDILLTFPQGRQVQGNDVEAIEEILTELALPDSLFQINIGSRNNPHIQSGRAIGTDPLYFLLLQYPQKLALQMGRHGADFIKENRTVVSRFEFAGLVTDRAGESALDMAEQLTLQQGFRYRSAVDRHKRPAAALSVMMQRPGHQFLSGA